MKGWRITILLPWDIARLFHRGLKSTYNLDKEIRPFIFQNPLGTDWTLIWQISAQPNAHLRILTSHTCGCAERCAAHRGQWIANLKPQCGGRRWRTGPPDVKGGRSKPTWSLPVTGISKGNRSMATMPPGPPLTLSSPGPPVSSCLILDMRWSEGKPHGVEPLGISKAGHTVSARLMESQIWHQPTGSVWGELRKGQWPLLTPMPDTSASPCMLLMLFKLPPRCWSSEGLSLSRWVCVWVLEEELLGAPAVSSTYSILSQFCSQELWGLIFLALEP